MVSFVVKDCGDEIDGTKSDTQKMVMVGWRYS